jgi:hypothetical protein
MRSRSVKVISPRERVICLSLVAFITNVPDTGNLIRFLKFATIANMRNYIWVANELLSKKRGTSVTSWPERAATRPTPCFARKTKHANIKSTGTRTRRYDTRTVS